MQTHKESLFREGDFDEWVYFNVRHFPHPVMEFIPWPIKVSGLIFDDGSEMWTAGGGGSGPTLVAGTGISLVPGMGTITVNNTLPGLPAGSNGQLQFNNGGNFGGSPNLAWNNATRSLGIGTNAPMGGISTVVVGNPAQAGTITMLATTSPGLGLVDLVSNAWWNGSVWSQIDPAVSSWDVGFRDSTATEVANPSLWSVRYMAPGDPPAQFPRTRLAITREGNVGIGTDFAAFKLDVLGDLNITGQYRINGVPISFRGNAHVDSSPPGSPQEGDFWFDDMGLKLYIRFSGTWVGI